MTEPKLSLVVVTGHLSRALDGFHLAMDELAALADFSRNLHAVGEKVES